MISVPPPEIVLQAGDVLRVRCDLEKFKRSRRVKAFYLNRSLNGAMKISKAEDTKLVEAVVALNSDFIGKSLEELQFRENFGATVLALRHRGKLMREKIADTKLNAGDALLLEVKTERYNQFSKILRLSSSRKSSRKYFAATN